MRTTAVWVVMGLLAASGCSSKGYAERAPRGERPQETREATREAARAATTAAPAPGCGRARLLPVPGDPAARGPWPVGLRTVAVEGVTADVYYPARPGSGHQVPRAFFDLRDHLPLAAQEMLRGGDIPVVPCRCARELPLDTARGPYPVAMFFHGRGLTRAQFPTLAAHLASRGFVVIAPDIPGATFAALSEGDSVKDRAKALSPLFDALAARRGGPLAFLLGHVDGRLGLVGHSLGAGVVQDLVADGRGDVAVVMGAGGLRSGKRRVPVLVLGGAKDGFQPLSTQRQGYERDTRAPKRLVGVTGAGHMHFADHCAVATDEGGWYAAAAARSVPMKGFLEVLADKGCTDGTWSVSQTQPIILAATTAQLEETLMCDRQARFTLSALARRRGVDAYREDLDEVEEVPAVPSVPPR